MYLQHGGHKECYWVKCEEGLEKDPGQRKQDECYKWVSQERSGGTHRETHTTHIERYNINKGVIYSNLEYSKFMWSCVRYKKSITR